MNWRATGGHDAFWEGDRCFWAATSVAKPLKSPLNANYQKSFAYRTIAFDFMGFFVVDLPHYIKVTEFHAFRRCGWDLFALCSIFFAARRLAARG
jgi:hypothetical protein